MSRRIATTEKAYVLARERYAEIGVETAAVLEPTGELRNLEMAGDFTARLALLEELKTMPFGAVWDYYCRRHDVPVGSAWLDEVKAYEKNVLSGR